ncbi:MAG: PEP-CTERM sorting domain-containing protein [Parvularculaceae bacterium]|nr:PEP-CTERM sorting domain-containing protein [Parvularculaceae bacterium]
MKITGFAAVAVALSLFFNGDAKAAISTFPASVFQTGGTGSNNLVGNTAGTARLARNDVVGLNYAAPVAAVAGSRLFFNFTQVSNNTTYLWVRLGNWNGTTFTSAASTGQTAPGGGATTNVYAQVSATGLVTVFLDPFLTSCQSIGGCNALVFGNSSLSANGSFFRLSTLVAATPEPSAWALMMIGFAGVAMRMKARRGNGGSRSALSLA